MRRPFIMVGLIVLIVAVFFISGSALAQEKMKWRGQSTWPAGMPILHEAAEYFAKKVGELSNGQLVIDMNPAGTIVPAGELVEAVHKGVVDVSCGWSSYWRGQFPAAPLFGSVEGGPETMEYLAWVLVGGGLELWQEMYDRKNWQVKVLPPYSAHGTENFGWSNKPIRNLEDFKGLRFRTGGYYWGKVLTKMGASVVTLPGSEVIPALERKVLDAAEWSMPGIDVTMGFHQICKYLIIPGVHQPSSLDETLVYKKSWEKLSPNLQAIVSTAARDASLYIQMREMKLNPPALQLFRDKGVNIITLSPEVQKRAKQLAEEVHAETAAQDPFFAKVLTSLNAFRKTWDAYKTAFAISYK
jgi:TRAP-type mannitol/chloroaromatic compound transport system substrate-binding protein